ncbi:NAD-dependent epimerase/dehydratase family protein [Thalassorhabdomicrobium marinisediminis]|uniref:NAD-dependent epimerase/dehydratase family protein n=1 Tax=Thalassorhabdomicrobium marinisediminis TaxID=2170577 RepID=UPI002492FD3C|nr:NAD-dependent epimerase/dehydratase family protein [Thalassorhabdomicrobium marinisediminis]
MTTIILGSTGRLGTLLARCARNDGAGWQTQARAPGADILWSGRIDDAGANEVFCGGATLINMIGDTGSDQDALTACNVDFVEALLERSARAGVAHVLLASSAAVYGAGSARPFEETDAMHPETPYAESKAVMERVAARFCMGAAAPAVTVARIGNVAGADALLAAARTHGQAGRRMALHRFGDGAAARYPRRSYIGPRDFFACIKALVTRPAQGFRVVNVTHPQPVSLDALLQAYRTHLIPDLQWEDAPAPAGIPPEVILSTQRLAQYITLPERAAPADALARQVAEVAI